MNLSFLVQFLTSKAQPHSKSSLIGLLHNTDLHAKLSTHLNSLRISYVPELYPRLQHFRHAVSVMVARTGVLPYSAWVRHFSMCGWYWRC